jgi:hypothetical protein
MVSAAHLCLPSCGQARAIAAQRITPDKVADLPSSTPVCLSSCAYLTHLVFTSYVLYVLCIGASHALRALAWSLVAALAALAGHSLAGLRKRFYEGVYPPPRNLDA